jgi:hypothetical protein
VTSAPATEAPPTEPVLLVEEIDLDSLEFIEVDGSVAYNETGAPLEWTAVTDGIPEIRKPRLQEKEGQIRVSLDDLSACLEGWTLSDEGTVVLEAEGHTLGFFNEDAGKSATVDGQEIPLEKNDFEFGEGHFIDAQFLARALGGEAKWDAEETTLMLRFPEK